MEFITTGNPPYFVVSYDTSTHQDLVCYMSHIGKKMQRIHPDEFLSNSTALAGSYINLVSMMNSTDRVKISKHMDELGCDRFSFFGSFIPKSSQMNDGCFIYPHVSILPNSRISQDVILHEGTVVGHYASIGKGTFTSMNVSLGGGSKIGEYCWIGAAAALADKIDIADHTTILMRSIVTRSITDNHTTYQKHR